METTWIDQRNDTDCAICCIAMALDLPYETVMEVALAGKHYDVKEGTLSVSGVLERLGLTNTYDKGNPVGEFARWDKSYHVAHDYFRDTLWGRPSIITVRSLNNGGHHAVFYDGEQLYDPSAKSRYLNFWSLEGIVSAVVFVPNFRNSVVTERL